MRDKETDIAHQQGESEYDNSTLQALEVRNKLESSTWTIKVLYPMVASYPILLSLAFVFYFIKDYRKDNKQSEEDESKSYA